MDPEFARRRYFVSMRASTPTGGEGWEFGLVSGTPTAWRAMNMPDVPENTVGCSSSPPIKALVKVRDLPSIGQRRGRSVRSRAEMLSLPKPCSTAGRRRRKFHSQTWPHQPFPPVSAAVNNPTASLKALRHSHILVELSIATRLPRRSARVVESAPSAP